MDKFIKHKKSQNEMVGFIVIVVIVVIIGLFLLILYLRQDNPKIESKNVENFLRASMLYTTSCAFDIEPLKIEEVIKSCYKNKECSDGKDACVALNETYSKLLEDSWKGSNTLDSYSLLIYYTERSRSSNETDYATSNVSDEIILSLKKGEECNGTEVGGEEFIYYGSGSIISEIKMCYIY